MDIKKLREEFAKLHGEATAIVEKAATEERELTADEKTANDGRFARLTAIQKTIDEHLRFAGLAFNAADEGGDKENGDGAEPSVQLPASAPGKAEFEAAKPDSPVTKFTAEQIKMAFNRWASTGDMDRKFATITTATASSALLPKEIATPIVPTTGNVFRQASAIYGVAPVQTGTTAAMTYPVMDASAGGQVDEDATSETENEPGLTQSILLNVKTYQSGSAWFSNMQLSALDFDLVGYIQSALTYSKELGLEAAIASGIVADSNIAQVVTTDATTGITYGNLVDLNMALPKKFDAQKAIILSKTAFAAASKLVDDNHRPVLVIDPQNQSLVRFNGTPVLWTDNFDAMGASKTIGSIISLIGFKIRDVTVQNLARYTQNAAKPDQTGFNLFGYHGFGWAPSAVAKLKTPAS